jgi:parallel beta-helix repeat protein
MRRLSLIRLLIVVAAALAVVGASACPAATLYVAADGNDAWSGKSAEPNAAKTDGPFASLQRARDAVRMLKKADGLPGGVTVFVRRGTYEFAKPFQLTPEDSGAKNAPVVYRAYRDEKPLLTGAKRISGFVPYRAGILKADVAAQGFEGRSFRQLFFNGKRQVLARYPNFDPANPYGGGYAYVDGPLPKAWDMYHDRPDDSAVLLHYRAKDARRWLHPELGEINIFARYNWTNEVVPIASVNRESRTIRLSRAVGYKAIRPYDRYYVRNLFEELDAPGEWYLDRQTWMLYFWPPGPIGEGAVRAAMTDSLIEIGPGVSWITVQGFAMEGSDGAAVVVRASENCLIAGNTIHDTSGRFGPAAVEIQGGRRCGAVGNDIFNVENGGIRLSGGNPNALSPTEHYAENNYIHHVGLENGHSCGVWLQGVGLRVSHNLIHDVSRCGIFGGGPDCIVEYNHVRHVNLETEDTGGYYNGGMWHIRGEVIRYNFIHDTLGYGRSGDRWVSPYFSWGIYLDDDQSYTHVYGNIVARTASGGCHIHAGSNNVIENNIFVESSGPQIQYSGHDPKSPLVTERLKAFTNIQKNTADTAKYPDIATANLDTIWHMAGNKTCRNIIYYRNPKSDLYGIRHVPADPFRQNQIDSNLVWHCGSPIAVSLNGKSVPWQDWQKDGRDAHSVVADPRFVDADKDDYRLKPDSPAFKLGFQSIPVEKIGPYKDERRASWPIVEAEGVRERPLPAARILLPDKTPAAAARPKWQTPR